MDCADYVGAKNNRIEQLTASKIDSHDAIETNRNRGDCTVCACHCCNMRFAIVGFRILLCVDCSKKELCFDGAGTANGNRRRRTNDINFLNNQLRGNARDCFSNALGANDSNDT